MKNHLKKTTEKKKIPNMTATKISHNKYVAKNVSLSVVFNSLRSRRLKSDKLLCPWNSLRWNTGMGIPVVNSGWVFTITVGLPHPGIKPRSPALYSLPREPPRNPKGIAKKGK